MSTLVSGPVGVVGFGQLGQALATIIATSNNKVLVWSRSGKKKLSKKKQTDIQATADLGELLTACRLVIFTSPATVLTQSLPKYADAARADHYWVHSAKGCDEQGRLGHEIIRAHTVVRQIGVLGGPMLASDLIKHGPGGLLIASRFDVVNKLVKTMLSADRQRVFTSHDLVGLELAGAMRNVISMVAGLASSLPEAARAELLSRGLIETIRLGVALGADADTFVGVAGVGDFIARRDAKSSSNFAFGQGLAQGEDVQKMLDKLGTVEGYVSATALSQRAQKIGIQTPLASGLARVIANKIDAKQMLNDLLHSDPGLGSRHTFPTGHSRSRR